ALYSSLLTTWRRERATGVRQALAPQRRGPKSKRDPVLEENQKLHKENQRLTEQLRKAEIVIDVQKKWARCWGGRSQPQSRMGSRDGRRASIGSHRRHSVCLRGSWCCARLLLSSTGVRPGAAHARDPSPGSCPGVAWRGTRSGTRRPQLRAFSRLRSCCNSSHFARRRPISVLHTNHVSCSRTRRRHARTTRSAHPSRI